MSLESLNLLIHAAYLPKIIHEGLACNVFKSMCQQTSKSPKCYILECGIFNPGKIECTGVWYIRPYSTMVRSNIPQCGIPEYSEEHFLPISGRSKPILMIKYRKKMGLSYTLKMKQNQQR